MNCHDFQNELFEYVEGSLPVRQRRAAEAHLVDCPTCRFQLRQAERVAQTLARGFQQHTAELTLPPGFSERLLATLHASTPEKSIPIHDAVQALWLRLLWPVAMTACLFLVCLRADHLSPGASQPVRQPADLAVAVDLSYRLPAWEFHQEGSRMVDTLSYETVVASGTLPPAGAETLPPIIERNIKL